MKVLFYMLVLLSLVACRDSSQAMITESPKTKPVVEEAGENADDFKVVFTPRAADSAEVKTIEAFK